MCFWMRWSRGATSHIRGVEQSACQYHMTSYDDSVDRSDLNPAYGFHLHDPRLLEYAGAPELAHLLELK